MFHVDVLKFMIDRLYIQITTLGTVLKGCKHNRLKLDV